MTKKGWIIFFVLVVGFLLILVLSSRNSQSLVDVGSVDVFAVQEANEKNGMIKDHIYGNPDSNVMLLEYGDYQCPGCGNLHPIMKQLVEDNKNDVKLIFRNYPIVNAHPNARAAAAAAEAAGLQGKYWEMHNKLYESQQDWSFLNASNRTDKFVSYAKDLNLDTEKFKNDMALESINQKINYDFALAKKQNVSSTPTLFINSKQVNQETLSDLEKLKTEIQQAITKSKNQ